MYPCTNRCAPSLYHQIRIYYLRYSYYLVCFFFDICLSTVLISTFILSFFRFHSSFPMLRRSEGRYVELCSVNYSNERKNVDIRWRRVAKTLATENETTYEALGDNFDDHDDRTGHDRYAPEPEVSKLKYTNPMSLILHQRSRRSDDVSWKMKTPYYSRRKRKCSEQHRTSWIHVRIEPALRCPRNLVLLECFW